MPALSAYGLNPNRGATPNADNGWGSWKWPTGVPFALLGRAAYGDIAVTVRTDLVPLFVLAFRIAEALGYKIYAKDPSGSGALWGPWSYENRPIGGTLTASNHSRGRAMDVNAPRNPQSGTFQSDLPVELVAAWERIGFYWGGRYTGVKYDTMHFEYAYAPSDVARHVAVAEDILARLSKPADPAAPTKPPTSDTSEEDELNADQDARLKNMETILGGLQNAIGDPKNGVLFHAAEAHGGAQAAKASADNAANIASEVRNLITDPDRGVLSAIGRLTPTQIVAAIPDGLADQVADELSKRLGS